MSTRATDSALGGTSTGMSPRLAACLAYSVWWASGLLMLAVEPRNQFVRFHAAQALLGLGVLWCVGVALWGLTFLMAFVSPPAFRAAAVLGPLVWCVGIGAWGWCTFQAARGRSAKLPWAGGRAEAWVARHDAPTTT